MIDVWNGKAKTLRMYTDLTVNDLKYLQKKGIQMTSFYKFDMTLCQVREEDWVYLRSFGESHGIHFTKEEIPILRTLARRHSFRMIPAPDFALTKLEEKK